VNSGGNYSNRPRIATNSIFSAFDYPKPPPPIRRGLSRRGWRHRKRGVQQVANRPHMTVRPSAHAWPTCSDAECSTSTGRSTPTSAVQSRPSS